MTSEEIHAAGLCSVVPTIFQNCDNDWISKNGTCYQDSCCMSLETATSWYYRLAQFSHVVFSFMGLIIVVVYILRYRSRHILPENVRVLVDFMLLFIVAHSIDMIVLHIYHIIQSFQANISDPCFVREKVSFCAPFRYTFSFCSMGLAICTYCIYIDRLACAYYKNYTKHQRLILAAQICQLIVISSLIIIWVYRNEEPNTYLLSCLNVPVASVEDMAKATIAVFPINFICFFLSIGLFRHFKKKEEGSRFDIVRHFTASVDVESSEFLFRTTGTQAALMALFSVASLLMRLVYNFLPRQVGLTIATLSYIMSIYCFTVPLVIVKCVQKTSALRKSRISSHVGLKAMGVEGASNYFEMMKSQWE
ncbi:Serpentine receptor class beta-18 [Caenorhabditis elegans]|uniref:Serpentine receptor class beta-18 n=1 Tax=Caenorhabditis elegans TaxID=6239 RepID=SRB18_CAEEL|nr:Serpentine receptor class beta-18 [Caenorhabditis elegans]O16444.3 RecName: Full=Serpentine receptor class beta-18; Short=Protein srb-18 [Caenorhabditis elegans]CCD62998.1 Serpentine receptor class beta-18 [Caenorhabditis elegans]|eukprot:NP_504935.3 Serpentine receptor class beta-18 [Caenorhabditis elegans]